MGDGVADGKDGRRESDTLISRERLPRAQFGRKSVRRWENEGNPSMEWREFELDAVEVRSGINFYRHAIVYRRGLIFETEFSTPICLSPA